MEDQVNNKCRENGSEGTDRRRFNGGIEAKEKEKLQAAQGGVQIRREEWRRGEMRSRRGQGQGET
eukprot:749436-Hanusia_phi.AAC.3